MYSIATLSKKPDDELANLFETHSHRLQQADSQSCYKVTLILKDLLNTGSFQEMPLTVSRGIVDTIQQIFAERHLFSPKWGNLEVFKNKQQKFAEADRGFPDYDTYTYLSPTGNKRDYYKPRDNKNEVYRFLKGLNFFDGTPATYSNPFIPCYLGIEYRADAVCLDQMCTLIALKKSLAQIDEEKTLLNQRYANLAKKSEHPVLDLDFYPISKKEAEAQKWEIGSSRTWQNEVKCRYFERALPCLYWSNYYAMHLPNQEELVNHYQMDLEQVAEYDYIILYHRPKQEIDTQIFQQAPFTQFKRFKKRMQVDPRLTANDILQLAWKNQLDCCGATGKEDERLSEIVTEYLLIEEIIKLGGKPSIGGESYRMHYEIQEKADRETAGLLAINDISFALRLQSALNKSSQVHRQSNLDTSQSQNSNLSIEMNSKPEF